MSNYLQEKDDGSSKEWKYDPLCGMTKEEFEWRCAQIDKVSQRMPQVLDKVDIHLRAMRRHFLDDLDGLKKWDEHQNYVRHSFAGKFFSNLLRPSFLPNSVLYEQLMKRKARSRTYVGMLSEGLDRLKRSIKRNKRLIGGWVIVPSVAAAAFALGAAVGRTPPHGSKEQTNET